MNQNTFKVKLTGYDKLEQLLNDEYANGWEYEDIIPSASGSYLVVFKICEDPMDMMGS